MYICHPRGVFLAGYGWFEGKILTLIFVYITFYLLTEPQTMLQLKILMTQTSEKVLHTLIITYIYIYIYTTYIYIYIYIYIILYYQGLI